MQEKKPDTAATGTVQTAGHAEAGQEPANEISQAEVSELVASFVSSFLADKPMYSGLIGGVNVSVTPKGQIVARFDSQLQVDMFQDIKSDLVQYLRERTGNRNIDITEQVADGSDEGEKNRPKLFTAEDKFKFLAQKNPGLIKLKQRFNLDL